MMNWLFNENLSAWHVFWSSFAVAALKDGNVIFALLAALIALFVPFLRDVIKERNK